MLFQNLSKETQTINGIEVEPNDFVDADMSEGWNEQDGIGEDGPWGWGGYTTKHIEENALSIEPA